MTRVFKPERILICVLMAFAGCSTAPRPRAVPDWDSMQPRPPAPEVEHVTELPPFAPPPVSPPGPTPPQVPSYGETWVPLARWSRENQAGVFQRVSSLSPAPVFSLTTPRGVLTIQVNSLVADWDGQQLHLGFTPQLIDNQPYLHTLDLAKSVQPLMQPFVPCAKTNRVVVIDPGHGGQNLGTRSTLDGALEKEFSLDWALRLAPLLSSNGWQVYLTRTNDVFVSLTNRVVFAEEQKADLFLSLHFNASGNTNSDQNGIEIYCLTPRGMSSTLTRGYKDDPASLFPGNAFDSENWQYAYTLQRALLRVTGATDRGLRKARFMDVLQGHNRPAVLIEGGYLSNPREARQIADPAYRQKLAEAIAAALQPETGDQKPETGGQNPELRPPPSTNTNTNNGLKP